MVSYFQKAEVNSGVSQITYFHAEYFECINVQKVHTAHCNKFSALFVHCKWSKNTIKKGHIGVEVGG